MTDATLLDQGDTVSFAGQHERATHADYAPANDGGGTLFNHGCLLFVASLRLGKNLGQCSDRLT
ncbi:hypothetical protein X741_33345 [Mesorhizobium sp. LNHC229A00]|nr:hypothetical protein X741_33345 [Mesorhizobium sp. LNHC229A00]